MCSQLGDPSRTYTLDEAIALDRDTNLRLHREHLNPRLAGLCELIGADVPLTEARGAYVWDADGTRYLDFVSGYAALNLGHNHPSIDEALDRVKNLANLVEGPGTLPAALARNLSVLTGRKLPRVLFANSGAEVVDAAIKLARAATRRTKLVSCHGCFHGRTVGALSVMSRTEFRQNFEPLVAGVSFVPYGDADSLESALERRDVAAFLVEPVQGEGGIVVPPEGYLRAARAICSAYGTMLIADEIQTGLGRTGRMFAVEHDDVTPDALLLGKALGGGATPISAILTTEEHWEAAHGGTPQSPFQFPTFGGSTRACAAALATLEILQADDLVPRGAALGEYLLGRLRDLQKRHSVVQEVRGRGLMIGIEFAPATRGLATLVTGGLLNSLSHEYFAGLVLMELRTQHRVMTLNTLNDANVLRAQPPLIIGRDEADVFVDALDQALARLPSFPRAAFQSRHLLRKARQSAL
jgi:putrescine aminotransferase